MASSFPLPKTTDTAIIFCDESTQDWTVLPVHFCQLLRKKESLQHEETSVLRKEKPGFKEALAQFELSFKGATW